MERKNGAGHHCSRWIGDSDDRHDGLAGEEREER